MNKKLENNKIPDEALKLLPWYATGWLSPEERKYMRQVLSKHPEILELLQNERDVIHLIKDDPGLLDLSVLEPVDLRLKSVFDKIDLVNNHKELNNQSFITRLGRHLQSFIFGNTSRQQYAGIAIITTLSIALLFAFVSPLLEQSNYFHPTSAELSSNKNSNNKTILLVGLNTDHNNPKLLKVLSEAQAKLASVPGKDGMYRVSLPKELNPDQTKQLLKKLTTHKDLFWFAGEAY